MIMGMRIPQVIQGVIKIAWPFSLAFGRRSRVGCHLSRRFLCAKSRSPYKRRNEVIVFLGETTKLSVEMNLDDCYPWALFYS